VGRQTIAEDYYIRAYECPKCAERTIDVICRLNDKPEDETRYTIRPQAPERVVPSEVPEVIASDYREATRIAHLGQKGSATIARRCLQATLRSSFAAMPRGDLYDEIEWVEKENKLPKEMIGALHSLRKAGNFGAHPSDDGLTMVYELSDQDLEACFILLDSLFDYLFVKPRHEKDLLDGLRARMFPKRGETAADDCAQLRPEDGDN
jgi:hypothetical protein